VELYCKEHTTLDVLLKLQQAGDAARTPVVSTRMTSIVEGYRRLSLVVDLTPLFAPLSAPEDPVAHPGERRIKGILRLSDQTGIVAERVFGQYLVYNSDQIDEYYFRGGVYMDYEVDIGYSVDLLEIITRYVNHRGKLLDVGCATGVFVQRALRIGFDAYGLDASSYAVRQAAGLVGNARVVQCNLDKEPIPFAFDFDVVNMGSILEHLCYPEQALGRVSAKMRPGGILLIYTLNSSSLMNRLFRSDWEGYYDYTHKSVDRINKSSLMSMVTSVGFEIVDIWTQDIWVVNVDPLHRFPQELYARIPEFRYWIRSLDLGDAIFCVARKKGAKR